MQSNPYWPPAAGRWQSGPSRGPICQGRIFFLLANLLLGVVAAGLPMRAAGQVSGQLVINAISDTTVTLGNPLVLQVSVSNTGVSAGELMWTLQNNLPAGATIANGADPSSAIITWRPIAAQAPSTNTVVVQVQDSLNTGNAASTSFQVIVLTNPADNPPTLDPIDDTNIVLGATLTLTASAQTTDGTANPLVYSLDSGAPAGATINPSTGVFTWTPTLAQVGDSLIGVIVTENGSSVLTDEAFFTVTVILTNNCPGYADFVAAVTQGGYVPLPDCPSIVLSNTLVVTTDTTIDAGASSVLIYGNSLLRLFTVLAPATLTLNGLTLSGGQSTNGGAIYVQAGASAVITDCVFSKNSATGSNGVAGATGKASTGTGGNGGNGTLGGPGYGGAIYNAGDLTISTSQFQTNSAVGGTGGSGGGGGNGNFRGGNGGNGGNGGGALGAAIYNLGTASIDSCNFESNTVSGGFGGSGGTNGTALGLADGLPGIGGAAGAASGGGLYSTGSALVVNCLFSGNGATGGTAAAGGSLSSGNGSDGLKGGDASGGGIFSAGSNAVTNCTFFGNIVTGGNGGNGGPGSGVLTAGGNGGNGGNGTGAGLYTASGTNWVVNCTFAQNQTAGGTNGVAGSGVFNGTDGNPGAGRGAGVARGAGTFFLQNSILATNAPGNNAYGTITDGGYNISSDASPKLTGTSTNKTDPKIGALADNGGPTETMALLAGSPAIDRINPASAPDVDQRGVPRPQGTNSDIGAYEALGLYSISGHVLNGGNGVSGVTVAANTNSAVTDLNGAYSITGVPAGDYFVFASKAGSQFSPSQEVTVGPSAAGINFTLQQPVYTVSGRVLLGGAGLSGVAVFGRQVTDANGFFNLSFTAGTNTLTPIKAGYFFSPSSRDVIVPPSATNQDFVAGSFITSIKQRADGSVQLTLAGIGQFRIETSSNLVDWVSVYTNTANFTFIDSTTAGVPLRFYRAIQP